jgi:hypothetical protein
MKKVEENNKSIENIFTLHLIAINSNLSNHQSNSQTGVVLKYSFG